ncbi:MAG: SRPBCC family protein [Gemmatimonadales bacterium]
MAAVLLAVASGLAHGQTVGRPAVTIGRDGTSYTVAAAFTVPQPVSTVLEVLSDYEGIPRFMPDIKKSIVLERTEARTVVEQEAVSRVMLFSKRVYLMLEVHRDHDTLRFRDISQRSFRRYEGAWQVTHHDGQTLIAYRLAADPSFTVPAFLIRRLLERDVHETIGRLRAEISRRGRRGADEQPPRPPPLASSRAG